MAALCLGAACSDNPAGGDSPRAGTLTLRLTTPHADDGAMTFDISGPAIDSVVAANGSLRLFTRREGGATVIGALVGALASGAVVKVYVPDATVGGYGAHLREVADRQDVLRASLAGYSLDVAP